MTCVVPDAAAAISDWLRTVKSSASPGSSLWLSRSTPRTSSCAATTSSGVAVLPMICVMKLRPESRVCTVVYGASTTSSWSRPSAVCPLAASTPMISNGSLRTRSCWPTGSVPGEELVGDRFAEQRDLPHRAHFGDVEEPAAGHAPVADGGVVRRHAVDLRAPVAAAADDLRAGRHHRRHAGEQRCLALQRLGIVGVDVRNRA